MDFGNALNALRAGHKVARGGWTEREEWLRLDAERGLIDVKIIAVGVHAWTPTQTDILASDWEIVD